MFKKKVDSKVATPIRDNFGLLQAASGVALGFPIMECGEYPFFVLNCPFLKQKLF